MCLLHLAYMRCDCQCCPRPESWTQMPPWVRKCNCRILASLSTARPGEFDEVFPKVVDCSHEEWFTQQDLVDRFLEEHRTSYWETMGLRAAQASPATHREQLVNLQAETLRRWNLPQKTTSILRPLSRAMCEYASSLMRQKLEFFDQNGILFPPSHAHCSICFRDLTSTIECTIFETCGHVSVCTECAKIQTFTECDICKCQSRLIHLLDAPRAWALFP